MDWLSFFHLLFQGLFSCSFSWEYFLYLFIFLTFSVSINIGETVIYCGVFMWEHFYVNCMCPVSLVQEIFCECQPHPSSGVLVTITLIGGVACVEGAKTCTRCEIGFLLCLVASPSYQKRGLLPSCWCGSLEGWAGFVPFKCVFPSPHTGALPFTPEEGGVEACGACALAELQCAFCVCVCTSTHTAQSCLLPCCGCPRSSTRLWHEVSRPECSFALPRLEIAALQLQELKQLCQCQKAGLLLWCCLSERQNGCHGPAWITSQVTSASLD